MIQLIAENTVHIFPLKYDYAIYFVKRRGSIFNLILQINSDT